MKNTDDGISDQPYSSALVTGIDCYPCKWQLPWARRKLSTGQRSSFLWIFTWPLHAHKVLCGYTFGQNYCRQRCHQRPCSQAQGLTRGQSQVQGEIQEQPEQTVLPEAQVLGLSCFSHKKTKTKKPQQAPFLVYWIGLWSPKIVTCFQTFQVSLMQPASAWEPLDSTEGLNLRAFSLTIPSA